MQLDVRIVPSMSSIQVLFMGTGTSTSLPLAPCLTRSFDYPPTWEQHVPRPITPSPGRAKAGHYDSAGPWPRNILCACCRSSQDTDVPEGWKNRRGNTSLIVRKRGADGEWKNVLLDCGKTFVENARRFFPRWRVKTIDAVLLTHGHADAYFGLDDLREWCIRSGRHIPVYLNQETYKTVAESFPYLVDASKASGGGDIPNLAFHIIDDLSSFTVCDIQIDSFPVHHGIYFAPADPKAPSSPEAEARPLICLAYAFDKSVLYMADVSEVPERTWNALESMGMAGPSSSRNTAQFITSQADTGENSLNGLADRINGTLTVNGSSSSRDPFSSLQILIIDALWPQRRHLSHLSFSQALDTALRIRPHMTYLLGSTHPTTHFMWEEICLAVSGRKAIRSPTDSSSPKDIDWRSTHPDREASDWLIDRIRHDSESTGRKGKSGILDRWAEFGGEVEPAWDGLVLEISDPSTNSISSSVDAQTLPWSVVSGPEGSTGGWGI